MLQALTKGGGATRPPAAPWRARAALSMPRARSLGARLLPAPFPVHPNIHPRASSPLQGGRRHAPAHRALESVRSVVDAAGALPRRALPSRALSCPPKRPPTCFEPFLRRAAPRATRAARRALESAQSTFPGGRGRAALPAPAHHPPHARRAPSPPWTARAAVYMPTRPTPIFSSVLRSVSESWVTVF
ncbi:hypothetical protein B0H10DRAFT_1972472 [Mycena sp. CBHHK59/15]|nr:hypothetical protein B0H10DRAFT_1972472 [Mycena sp. CBHHK59/15]